FDVAYICLHAISKDTSTYPTPCIYCQVRYCRSVLLAVQHGAVAAQHTDTHGASTSCFKAQERPLLHQVERAPAWRGGVYRCSRNCATVCSLEGAPFVRRSASASLAPCCTADNA
ncbi:unnamed protein product, partial [Ascophyllum nodosum]